MTELYPWQTECYQKLLQANKQQRLPHGLLLSAKKGSGRQQFVSAWSQKLLCSVSGSRSNTPLDAEANADQSASQSNDFACGVCKSCQLFNAGTHPDYHWVAVAEDKKQISIDQIRSTTQVSLEKSHLSGWRVIVIFEAEKMTINGYNALLKTLEEPGDKLQLILVTDNRSSIPATIISRCQHFIMNSGAPIFVDEWLDLQIANSSADDRQLALGLSFGAPLEAKALLSDQQLESFYQVKALLLDVFKGIRTHFAVSEQSHCEPLQLLRWWAFIISEVMFHYYQKPKLTHPQLATLAELAEITDVRLLFSLREDILFQIKQLTTGVSLNVSMQLDSLGDKWSKCRIE